MTYMYLPGPTEVCLVGQKAEGLKDKVRFLRKDCFSRGILEVNMVIMNHLCTQGVTFNLFLYRKMVVLYVIL